MNKEKNQNRVSDAKAIPHHIPLGDPCPDSLQAMTTYPNYSFPSCLLLSMMLHSVEYAFGQFGSAVLVVSPLSIHILNVLASGTQWEKEKTLMLCKHRPAIVRTLLSTQFLLQIQNVAPYGML